MAGIRIANLTRVSNSHLCLQQSYTKGEALWPKATMGTFSFGAFLWGFAGSIELPPEVPKAEEAKKKTDYGESGMTRGDL
jgi:hypothetical protein